MKTTTTNQEGNASLPLVSVIIVTYNHEQYIGDCLSSVVSQNCRFSFEIIVGDDHSKDATPHIISTFSEKYPGLVVPVLRKQNLGPTQNQFDLIKRARGEYICHLDGDDIALPWKLERQVDFLKANPDCSAVYHNAFVFDDSHAIKGVFNNRIPEKFDRGFLIRKGNFLFHSSIMYKSNFRDQLYTDTTVLDYYIHIVLADNGKLGYINAIMGGYRTGSSTSMILNSRKIVQDGYFHALMTAYQRGFPKNDVYRSVGIFLCGIFLSSMVTFDVSLFRVWCKKIEDSFSFKVAYLNKWFYLHLLSSVVNFPFRKVYKFYLAKTGGVPVKCRR